MFRSSTILRELVQSQAKVTLLLKQSVKLCRILCGAVAACREMACVLFVVQTETESKAQMTLSYKNKQVLYATLLLQNFSTFLHQYLPFGKEQDERKKKTNKHTQERKISSSCFLSHWYLMVVFLPCLHL